MIQQCVDPFCIGFIDFMLKGKILLDNTKLFSPNQHTKKAGISSITKLNISFVNRF